MDPLKTWCGEIAHSANAFSAAIPENWPIDEHSEPVHLGSCQHDQQPQTDTEPGKQSHINSCLNYKEINTSTKQLHNSIL